MKPHLVLVAGLLAGSLAAASCTSRHDSDEYEQKDQAGAKTKPVPAPVKRPTSLRDTVQLLMQQLDTVRRIGCWDEDFARVMTVHHAGAQRLASVEIAQGQDSTLRAMAKHVLKGHERDNHVLTLALTREPPAGQEYRPDNTKDPFVRQMTAALGPLRELPPATGSIDADFATLMQFHHQSGVALARVELSFGRNAEVKAAARNIVRDEQVEVQQYQRWLKAHAIAPSN
ncbi:DUF305 domain-containing protein (plasmid) [Hymenobacter sp. NBH84]|uniref:DUF305 domain-containing protein n=1 Tax=Hymenobacter sp. NBH84 TaxID=2596915 RepID=UPI00162944A5|nr:DUF305 domain-containing protein [Hymenobacter sp. NBH84]QNE42283.1 DUF305 domain-containing protein [Hymenobacter sp. NBH84]